MPASEHEESTSKPLPLNANGFNADVILPCGLEAQHIRTAMKQFLDYLTFINSQSLKRGLQRLEIMLMPANFSSLVGEFMVSQIGKACPSMVRNRYHNGYPDLIPAGTFTNDAVQRGDEGIEVKASRHLSGWQGHNPELGWLMVFMFDANSQKDEEEGNPPRPFRFRKVAAALLEETDWSFSGRSEKSRRTITASVIRSGRDKMMANWIYDEEPGLL